jgi:hypothetical protein
LLCGIQYAGDDFLDFNATEGLISIYSNEDDEEVLHRRSRKFLLGQEVKKA